MIRVETDNGVTKFECDEEKTNIPGLGVDADVNALFEVVQVIKGTLNGYFSLTSGLDADFKKHLARGLLEFAYSEFSAETNDDDHGPLDVKMFLDFDK